MKSEKEAKIQTLRPDSLKLKVLFAFLRILYGKVLRMLLT